MASSSIGKVESSFHEAKSIAEANNYLAVNLYRLLAQEKGNVFFSPFSLSTCMAMLLCAAEGDTAAEMKNALGYDYANIKRENIASTFELHLSALLNTSDSCKLACANSVVCQKAFNIKEEYKTILTNSFKALLMEVDFRKDAGKTTKLINGWVKDKTRKMIPKLVDRLETSTAVVLLNAIYFKGDWSENFKKKNTRKKQFFNYGSKDNATKVDMMYMKAKFLYTNNEKFQALQLPYSGKEMAMLILLPRFKANSDSEDEDVESCHRQRKDKFLLKEIETSLNSSFIRDLKKSMQTTKVYVHLPRFRLEYSKSLKETFQDLGIKKVFKVGAELGVASDSPVLAVSEIIHKAVVEVNEKGTEAAAGTMTEIKLCSREFVPVFLADHPFVFAIYDLSTDLILFMGRVEKL